MTHDEAFAELRARKDAERAERDRGRVTWRKVSTMTGGGYSGIGAGGRLVYVVEFAGMFTYGIVVGRERSPRGTEMTLPAAKRSAAALLAETGTSGTSNGLDSPVEGERSRLAEERCPVCGGLNPGDASHTRC